MFETEKLRKNDEVVVEKTEVNNKLQPQIKNSFCKHIIRRISSQKRRAERIVFKNGQFNVEKSKTFKYHVFPDIVAAFIEVRWRWTLLYCIITYISIWLFFAGIWWAILFAHGDLEADHLPHASNITQWTPCVKEIYNFTSIFLFSIEVHTTIGYGARSITLLCPSAIITMCIESIIGTITQSFLVGIVFAKLTRPKNRAYTLMFTKNAVINLRDGHLNLIFRIGNTIKSRIISVSAHAHLLKCLSPNKVLDDQMDLKLSFDSSNDCLVMFPMTAVHKIDKDSPLYYMSAKDILKSELEIIVVFEGTIESTGQPVQAKSSYTAQEILWGHKFEEMVDYNIEKDGYVVDYSKFDKTIHVHTPLCSAMQLPHLYKERYK